MNRSNEFVPVGKHVSSARRLELDFMDQQDLISELRQTSRELESSPLAIPTSKQIKLGRIALLDRNKVRSTTDKLWIQYSETNDGRRNAVIDLLENQELTRLQLSQTENNWQVWANGAKTSSQVISNEQVVSTLYPKIGNKETLEALLDTADYDSMVIPHLLASYLEKSAHRRQKILQYSFSSPTIQGAAEMTPDRDSSFISSTDTNLCIFENNNRSIYTLSTSALHNIGNTNIRKGYSYEAEISTGKFYNAGGKVTVASADGYNQAQLDEYATTDQITSDPLFSLHGSLEGLRFHYGLDKEVAA
jgi:hypothetical protein